MTRKLETSLTSAVSGLDLIREAIPKSTDDELGRLQSLCAKLISTISVRQNNFANDIEHYAGAPDERRWNDLRYTLAELATEVTRMFKLLAREAGDFTIEKQDTYRDLMQGLADRQIIYREIDQLAYPPSTEDIARLQNIVGEYRRLRSSLIDAQKEIADFIQVRKQKAGTQRDDVSDETTSRHLVVLVHGIRDRARWHKEIVECLRAEGFIVEPTSHGRMNLIEFVLPISYFRRRAY